MHDAKAMCGKTRKVRCPLPDIIFINQQELPLPRRAGLLENIIRQHAAHPFRRHRNIKLKSGYNFCPRLYA